MSLYDGHYFALVTSTDLDDSINLDITKFELIEINVGPMGCYCKQFSRNLYPAQMPQTLSKWELSIY